MNNLDQYILRQCITPLLFVLLVATALVWMTQSLQQADNFIDNGQGFTTFFVISLLLIPSLLPHIIPFALFGSSAFALYRMYTDSEIAAMFAAGVSRWRISAPILLIAFIGVLATYYINVDLMPRSYRMMKQAIADIRADLASSVLRAGEFSNLGDKMTIYVDESHSGGYLTGLFIHDTRDQEETLTYMAERAVLRETQAGPMLALVDGTVQREDRRNGDISIVRFADVAVNISDLKPESYLLPGIYGRYIGELMNAPRRNEAEERIAMGLMAEAHSRFAGPLHIIAYVLIGIYAVIGGPISRRGVVVRLAIAALATIGIRLAAFLLQLSAGATGAYWAIYVIAIAPIVIVTPLLFRPNAKPRPVEMLGKPA